MIKVFSFFNYRLVEPQIVDILRNNSWLFFQKKKDSKKERKKISREEKRQIAGQLNYFFIEELVGDIYTHTNTHTHRDTGVRKSAFITLCI